TTSDVAITLDITSNKLAANVPSTAAWGESRLADVVKGTAKTKSNKTDKDVHNISQRSGEQQTDGELNVLHGSAVALTPPFSPEQCAAQAAINPNNKIKPPVIIKCTTADKSTKTDESLLNGLTSNASSSPSSADTTSTIQNQLLNSSFENISISGGVATTTSVATMTSIEATYGCTSVAKTTIGLAASTSTTTTQIPKTQTQPYKQNTSKAIQQQKSSTTNPSQTQVFVSQTHPLTSSPISPSSIHLNDNFAALASPPLTNNSINDQNAASSSARLSYAQVAQHNKELLSKTAEPQSVQTQQQPDKPEKHVEKDHKRKDFSPPRVSTHGDARLERADNIRDARNNNNNNQSRKEHHHIKENHRSNGSNKELTQMGQYPPNEKLNASDNGEHPGRWPVESGLDELGNSAGFFDNIVGCLCPIFSILNEKSSVNEMTNKMEQWEIPFESITDLEWLGSGAQGTVFRGKLKNEIVAVKKVRDLKETDIKHLRKLDHENIIKFKGVCTQAPVFCIIMEYCPYGPLQFILRDEEFVQPARLVAWAKQIALGMQYLHTHKIIHRDLKSPNILIGAYEIVKISDFGTSREWNEISTKMSFAGTVAWMAPEVIRSEPCSEKVDIWSYGVVLWEMLTCEIPYKDADSSAIIWGVGNYTMKLPIPETCPDGFRLIIELCWKVKPKQRPSFKLILSHLEIAKHQLLRQTDKQYFETRRSWKEDIRTHMLQMAQNGTNIHKFEQELIRKRTAEWKHAQDIRVAYENKLKRTNELFVELNEWILCLQEREREVSLLERKLLKTFKKMQSGDKTTLHRFSSNSFNKFQHFFSRARKYRSQYSSTPSAIHKRSTNTLTSDDEDTLFPSSQHFTVESNPDISNCINVISERDNDSSYSSSSCESDVDISESISVTNFPNADV
ncbi:Mitogen-activated protein kinase kinase kinase 12, partial [Pseudolycoriella hygida]